MRINHNDVLNTTLVGLERLWRARPLVILACAGFADEHWQIYNPHEFRTNSARTTSRCRSSRSTSKVTSCSTIRSRSNELQSVHSDSVRLCRHCGDYRRISGH